MNDGTRRKFPALALVLVSLIAVVVLACFIGCSSAPPLENWHTEKLSEDFTLEKSKKEVTDFDDYLELEDRLFRQLDQEIYAENPTGPAYSLERYSSGSAVDPRRDAPDWNRSFEFAGNGKGGVLLLHGMSDSPYSIRALAQALNRRGYRVIGIRLPGHGTIPSGLKYTSWQDMAAAVELAMNQLNADPETRSAGVHLIGYSTGATLALDFALKAINDPDIPVPDSLVLISPAIRVHAAARFAGFKNGISAVPGLGSLAWLTVMSEFDPYKYNSFATNAGTQVHRITTDVDRRIRALSQTPTMADFPPVLVFKSTVDFTVSTDALVDSLMKRLPPDKNELVLFDINRQASIKSTLLVADPGPLTRRLLQESDLPFAVTFITNESDSVSSVHARYKAPFSLEPSGPEMLGLSWPRGVISLSHVALPFPPDDPLYGQFPPEGDGKIYLGDLAFRGERGLLKLPEDWLLRMRYNPFFPYLEMRVFNWLEHPGDL